MAKDNAFQLNLPTADSLFSSQEERERQSQEYVLRVPAEDVHPYARQPYQTERLTQDLIRLLESIGRIGIESPLIVRPRLEGGYEIISGHRRDYCAGVHGLPERPIIVRNYTDDEADILVADFNIVREDNLPSELARAYKLRYDAMKRQGKRTDLTSGHFAQKLTHHNSRRELADTVGKTEDEVRRILRLNELIPPMLQMVDEKKIAVRPAAELSYLSATLQASLLDTMQCEDCTPSMAQALQMKELATKGELNGDGIFTILSQEKPNQVEQFKIPRERINRFFPAGTPAKKMEETIVKALELYQRKRERER